MPAIWAKSALPPDSTSATFLPVGFARQQRRQRRRAARLDQQFEPGGGKRHGLFQFRIADRQARRQADSSPGQRHARPASAPSGHRRWKACRPAPLTRSPAASERRMPSKFSGSTLWTSPTMPFSRQGDAADQPAAAAGHQHLIQRHAQPGGVFGDLQPHRALPRDDGRIVERLDQGGAAFGADACRNGFAVFALAVIENNFRAQRPRAFDLGARARRTASRSGPACRTSLAAAATPWA